MIFYNDHPKWTLFSFNNKAPIGAGFMMIRFRPQNRDDDDDDDDTA